MDNSPFTRFTDAEVRDMLGGADLTDANVATLGLTRIRTQRQRVLEAYRIDPNVDAIFQSLRREVPKSSIRAILCRAVDRGEIARDWAVRSRRGTGRART